MVKQNFSSTSPIFDTKELDFDGLKDILDVKDTHTT